MLLWEGTCRKWGGPKGTLAPGTHWEIGAASLDRVSVSRMWAPKLLLQDATILRISNLYRCCSGCHLWCYPKAQAKSL